jgi:uncharacterized protein
MKPDEGSKTILQETLDRLKEHLGDRELASLLLERVVCGLFFSGVKVSDGSGGICFTPNKSMPEAVCCPSQAKMMPHSGKMRGMPVKTVFEEMFSGNPLKKALGIAAMNALSSGIWARENPQGYRILRNKDAIDGIEIGKDANVVLVGALIPYLKLLKARGKPFWVLETDPAPLKADEMLFYAPADEAPDKVPPADILIITGTTLINDTLEGLLSLARPGAEIILVGPTGSMLPEALFNRGVRRVAGVIVTRPDDLLDTLAEAGSGYHFFSRSADKMVLERG